MEKRAKNGISSDIISGKAHVKEGQNNRELSYAEHCCGIDNKIVNIVHEKVQEKNICCGHAHGNHLENKSDNIHLHEVSKRCGHGCTDKMEAINNKHNRNECGCKDGHEKESHGMDSREKEEHGNQQADSECGCKDSSGKEKNKHQQTNSKCGCKESHEMDSREKEEHGKVKHTDSDCDCGHEHGERSGRARLIFALRVAASTLFLILGWLLPLPEAVRLAFFIPSYFIIGIDVVYGGLKGLFKGKALDERFLMTIASVGAFLVGEAPEGVLVMLLYQVGEFLTDLSLERSKRSVSALTKLRPDRAVVIKDGQEVEVAPEAVEVGDTIAVRPGERVPLDGKMIEGAAAFDLSALTGESAPVMKRAGDEVPAGAVNLDGRILLSVTKPFGQSAVMRILETVSDAAEKKTKTERFIKRFAKIYTPTVVAIAALVAVVPPLILGGDWMRFVHTALLFLVISCPCALVIAVPLTYFAGVGGASKQGILVKGGTVFDSLKKVKTIVFDKTGTLTEGVFKVRDVMPAEGVSKERLVSAVIAAERYGNHPIAKSVREAFGESNAKLEQYTEFSGEGVSVIKDGCQILAGNLKLMQKFNIGTTLKSTLQQGSTDESNKKPLSSLLLNEANSIAEIESSSVVYVAENGVYLGMLRVSDCIKEGAAEAISALKSQNLKTIMLTGDREESACAVARELGLDEYRAGLLPADKVSAMEEILKEGGAAFVGDGINDAPVLTRADVGFAMGGIGQDAAIEAADVVVMDDNPYKVSTAIKISKKTARIATQNIVFALGVKLVFMILGFAGIVNMWFAVFADVGVTLIAIVNALRAYRSGLPKKIKSKN